MLLRIALIALALSTLPGCVPPCNRGAVCSIIGSGKDEVVCDGSDYLKCEDKTRGRMIACENKALTAVCTPDGWSFEPGVPK